MEPLTLVIGNKNLSSWSLRPWLLLSESGLPFAERMVHFGSPGWLAEVGSPNGRVPVLRQGALTIWESLAICERVAELAPDRELWPRDPAARAEARAVSNEMHAGFPDLRNECSLNVMLRTEKRLSPGAARDLRRVDQLWSGCREKHGAGGPFLFGRFSIADAMFAPVVLRAQSYSLPLSPAARGYSDTMLALPSLRRWIDGAAAEVAAGIDDPTPHGALFSRGEAEQLARAWAAAWSRRDLEAVLALFAEEARFVSPVAAALTGSATVEGKPALRRYWTEALSRIQTLRFEVDEVAWDGDANRLLIQYTSTKDGRAARACELLQFVSGGKVIRGEAFYG